MSVQILVSLSQTNFSMFTITSVNHATLRFCLRKPWLHVIFPLLKTDQSDCTMDTPGNFEGLPNMENLEHA